MNIQHTLSAAFKLITALGIVAALSACSGAGNGEGLDDNGNPIIEGDFPDVVDNNDPEPDNEPEPNNGADAVTLAELQTDIFGAICSQCHIGSGAPQGLRLDSEDNSFNFLVDVDANEVPTLKRVAPGDPDNSYIVHKVEGRAGIVGSRMPLGQDPLSDADIQRIKDWIANGAPRNGTGTASTKLSATSHSLGEDFLELNFHFSRSLDLESIDAEDFTVSLVENDLVSQLNPADLSMRILPQDVQLRIANDSLANAQALEIEVQDPRFSTIKDSQGRLIDGDHDEIEGGSKRYVIQL